MHKLTIVNVSYPFSAVSYSAAGGAEQILRSIDFALVSLGYQSIVLAPGNSIVNGILHGCGLDDAPQSETIRSQIYQDYSLNIEQILNDYPVDLIHFHGIDFMEYVPQTDIPILVTLHLPLRWYDHKMYEYTNTSNIHFNCVSKYQFDQCREKIEGLLCIENGINIPIKTSVNKTKYHTLCIGRICPEKGYHLAIRASLRAGFTPILAGRVFSYVEHQQYFDMKIKPFVDNGSCWFVGIVGQKEKFKLFSTARCLLVPSFAQETSSLVAMEAMAFGVPVIAFKSGALNDIVRDGINGFLVNDEDEMVEAIVASSQIDSEVCHRIAKEYYSVERMTAQYLNIYSKLVEN